MAKYQKKTDGTKGGAPRKEIDVEQFKKLCALHCTRSEIASFFDISDETLDTRCKELFSEGFLASFNKYAANGKISLRRTQFKMAETNVAMAIFLGKQYLGQMDRSQIEQRVNNNDMNNLDLRALSNDELKQLSALLKKAGEQPSE